MLKKLSLFTLAMLFIPIIAWLNRWQWLLDTNLQYPNLDRGLLIWTEAGSTPYAFITCVLFMLWIMWLTRHRYSWLLVGFICASSILGTQIIKEGAKLAFKEPRPFVTQMFNTDSEQFYALSKIEQKNEVMEFATEDTMPIVSHQADELGYSFPSGHTIFAVSWLLLFSGFLLGQSGQAVFFSQIFAVFWAGLILISRLRLGMHYPIDLFVSTLIAWVFNLVMFIYVVPYLETRSLFKKRG
ncbi:phosphatase PAP2 family protein [Otariodibacter oris]|uniref:undecaprenyl-diphosphate phosphatase n=1 Tax=Otariodibacter oris TaxID=1032623 RepID=A0A420XI36_9PAST|nr:phosphatase PAP2 family protein [Otariodibacter oris]QGM80906.1 phosphatidylglycerophosphatase [Otariodibacter oris]RKR76919.1 phosphatidylglycerophosphatase [Otariodibacter oris]